MKVKCFDALSKDHICLAYSHKTMNIKELAEHFKTSARTIGRVLEERGLATPVPRLKGEAYQVMQYLREHGLDLVGLKAAMSVPALTQNNIQIYLNQCSKQDLASYFYTSGLVELAEIAQQAQANASQQQPFKY